MRKRLILSFMLILILFISGCAKPTVIEDTSNKDKEIEEIKEMSVSIQKYKGYIEGQNNLWMMAFEEMVELFENPRLDEASWYNDMITQSTSIVNLVTKLEEMEVPEQMEYIHGEYLNGALGVKEVFEEYIEIFKKFELTDEDIERLEELELKMDEYAAPMFEAYDIIVGN